VIAGTGQTVFSLYSFFFSFIVSLCNIVQIILIFIISFFLFLEDRINRLCSSL